MTKRTRVFFFVATGILAVGLATGLVASYVGFQNLTLIGQDGPAELAYVPADARFLAYASVRDVMDSDVRRRFSALRPDSASEADRLKEQTGIDFETDIDYVVAALWGTGGGSGPADGEPPLVLARGRFDQVRIEGFVREHGGDVEEYKGSRLLVQDEMRLALAFPEPGLAAIGPPGAVRAAIDTRAAGTNVRTNGELMAIVRDVDSGSGWVVAKFDELAGGRLPAEVAKQLPPIDWFSATGVIDSGVRGQLRVEARDEESARNLREVIRGFVALARLQAGQQAGLEEVLNSFQLAGEGRTVSLSFAIPPEMIDTFAKLNANRPRRPGPAQPQAAQRPPSPGL